MAAETSDRTLAMLREAQAMELLPRSYDSPEWWVEMLTMSAKPGRDWAEDAPEEDPPVASEGWWQRERAKFLGWLEVSLVRHLAGMGFKCVYTPWRKPYWAVVKEGCRSPGDGWSGVLSLVAAAWRWEKSQPQAEAVPDA